jgi:type II secretory pathway pseudopilin PulG
LHSNIKRKITGGFTAVELVAVVSVLLILAAIVTAVFIAGKDSAVDLRRTNAASTLNAAERSLLDFNSSTAPGLGRDPIAAPSDALARIVALKTAGFLVTLISTEDVVLTRTNGIYYWAPVRP